MLVLLHSSSLDDGEGEEGSEDLGAVEAAGDLTLFSEIKGGGGW